MFIDLGETTINADTIVKYYVKGKGDRSDLVIVTEFDYSRPIFLRYESRERAEEAKDILDRNLKALRPLLDTGQIDNGYTKSRIHGEVA